MFPLTSFQKNLHIPESSINILINLFFNHLKLINLINPNDFNDSTNRELLLRYDKCDETRGKCSFLPFDFLKEYIVKNLDINLIDNDKIKNMTKLELKKYYVDLLKEHVKLDNNFFCGKEYKGIKLKYFRKPLLFAKLTKTYDACRLIEDKQQINNKNFKFKTFDQNEILNDYDRNEWLSKYEIIDTFNNKYYSLTNKKYINFKNLICLRNLSDRNILYSEIANKYDWTVDDKQRFIVFYILYNSHFTSVIIDRDILIKNDKKKIVFFFNSCGYNPNQFNLDKNKWFINNSSQINNHLDYSNVISFKDEVEKNLAIDVLCEFLLNKFKITNFVFNTFSIQNFNSECGIFSFIYLYLFMDVYQQKQLEDINLIFYKYLYFNLLNLGCDLTYSYFRGIFFFTDEDIKLNGLLDNKEYLDSPDIFEIKNSKFINFNKIFNDSLNKFKKTNLID